MIAKIVGLGAENYDDSFDIKIQEIQNELSDLSDRILSKYAMFYA